MALLRPNATRLSLKYLRVSVFLQVSIFQLVSGNDDLIWFVAFNFKLNEFCCALIVGTVLPSFQVFFQGFFGELSPYCTTPSPWCSGSFASCVRPSEWSKAMTPKQRLGARYCWGIATLYFFRWATGWAHEDPPDPTSHCFTKAKFGYNRRPSWSGVTGTKPPGSGWI